ncbi:MAG: recombinase family protein [Eubacteriales bacterium]
MAENKKFGYARVSSKEQNEGRQIEALKNHGIPERDIYIDKQSGKDFDRPRYQIMKAQLRDGDEILISSLDRLGRSYDLIKKEWADLHAQGVCVRVLNMELLSKKRDDLTQKVIADIVLELLSYVAELERKNIRERQRQGIDLALKNGAKFGRPVIAMPDTFPSYYQEIKKDRITAIQAMKEMNLKPNTFYRLKQEYEAGKSCN